MPELIEPRRKLPLLNSYDVVVVGGGIAGVAAALSAARTGASVCLIEKACGLGGLATLGNVVIYLPICDGEGHQAIGGIGEELIRLAAQNGEDIPAVWREPHSVEERKTERYIVKFNAPAYMIALEKLLVEAGVDLWYDTMFSAVDFADGAVNAVIVQNKSGRIALKTKFVIDASGDADVCAACGLGTQTLSTNVLSNWFYYADEQGNHLVGLTEPFNADGSPSEDAKRGYSGVSGKDVSAHIINSHSFVLERLNTIREKSPNAVFSNVPMMPSFRMTRRLVGETTMTEAMSAQTPADLVGLCPSWRASGVVYGVPFGALYHQNAANLLTAGRCISSAGRLWDMTRVIPICALTGEIAGTAVGLCLNQNMKAIVDLPISQLQQKLLENGNILDAELIRGR